MHRKLRCFVDICEGDEWTSYPSLFEILKRMPRSSKKTKLDADELPGNGVEVERV